VVLAMTYTLGWIEEEHDFDALGQAWDELVGDAWTPFDSHGWYRAWWRAFGRGRLAIATAWEGERLAAVFPLSRARGGGLIAMANVHTPLYRPIAPDRGALAAVVGHALSGGAARLEITAVPDGEPVSTLMRDGAGGRRRRVLSERQHVSPIVETTGTFAAWRQRTKPRWRSDLDRFARNLRRRHQAAFSMVEPPADLESELGAGFQVEASGWKGHRGTAIASSPETEAFYREVATSFDRRGKLRLSRIELPGGVVAFDLCLLHDRRLYLLKTGFDERFRNLSPGLVLRLATIERCFELGLEAHELLGDDTEWKRKFATTERRHSSHRAYGVRPGSLSRLLYRSALRPRLRWLRRRVASGD
jgi:CelD/BcsL family acetyltransferase involved in cellulose biosynthesis